jgi:hypothetical protein
VLPYWSEIERLNPGMKVTLTPTDPAATARRRDCKPGQVQATPCLARRSTKMA